MVFRYSETFAARSKVFYSLDVKLDAETKSRTYIESTNIKFVNNIKFLHPFSAKLISAGSHT
jgi:hypothetical protein